MYGIKIISPGQANKKYILKDKTLRIIKEKIIPEIKDLDIDIFMAPLTIDDNNRYWIDFVYDYVNHYYGREYMDKSNMIITFKLNKNLTLNKQSDIFVNYYLNKKEYDSVYDICKKYLKSKYNWNKNKKNSMLISY